MTELTPETVHIPLLLRNYFQLLTRRPLSEFEAFSWILLSGPELITKLIVLSDTFGWPESRVQKFLDELERTAKIESDTAHNFITITVPPKFYKSKSAPAKKKAPKSEEDFGKAGLHPSPDAPKHLSREAQELECYDETLCYFTKAQLALLKAKLSPDEIEYWVSQMHSYFKDESKFKTYKSHYSVLLKWRQMRLEKGQAWANLPVLGKGYFYPRVIKENQ